MFVIHLWFNWDQLGFVNATSLIKISWGPRDQNSSVTCVK